MALFVPGVRKENQNLVEACVANFVPKHLDRVVANDAQVAKIPGSRLQQQPAHARPMHFDAHVVDVGIILRQRADHFSGPEADLEAARRTARKNPFKIQGLIAHIETERTPMFFERSLLCGGQSACPQDETSNMTGRAHDRKVCLI